MPSLNHRLMLPSAMTVLLALAGCGGEPIDSAPTGTNPPKTEAPASQPVEQSKPVVSSEQLGAKLYTRCRTCHTLDENGKNRVGPNLWNIFGTKAGSAKGFAYSNALKASDIVWNDETMAAYLENPKTFIPGNRMVFIGLKKQEDRQNLIAYLRANTGAE